jgi:hypothetical protein
MKKNAGLNSCPVQVGARQSTAQNHVVITPVQHPANMLLAWLVLGLPGQTQAKRKYAKQKAM